MVKFRIKLKSGSTRKLIRPWKAIFFFVFNKSNFVFDFIYVMLFCCTYIKILLKIHIVQLLYGKGVEMTGTTVQRSPI